MKLQFVKEHYLYIIILIAIVVLVLMYYQKSQPIKFITCPNTKEPITLVDINHVYPVYASSYMAEADIAMQNIKEIDKNLQGDLKTKIVNFREQLSQENIHQQEILNTALIGLQTTPCDLKAREHYWALIQSINNKSEILSVFNQEISNSVTTKDGSINTRDSQNVGLVIDLIKNYKMTNTK